MGHPRGNHRRYNEVALRPSEPRISPLYTGHGVLATHLAAVYWFSHHNIVEVRVNEEGLWEITPEIEQESWDLGEPEWCGGSRCVGCQAVGFLRGYSIRLIGIHALSLR